MKNKTFKAVVVLVIAVVAGLILKLANDRPRVEVKTRIDYQKITDSIKSTLIQPPDTVIVYIDSGKVKYTAGPEVIEARESIKDTAGASRPKVKAQLYPATLKANQATANLKILTTGQLLAVEGVIDYVEKTKTVETTKYLNPTSLFLYGEASALPAFDSYKAGVDYVIRDKVIVGTSLGFDGRTSQARVYLKIGFKIF